MKSGLIKAKIAESLNYASVSQTHYWEGPSTKLCTGGPSFGYNSEPHFFFLFEARASPRTKY